MLVGEVIKKIRRIGVWWKTPSSSSTSDNGGVVSGDNYSTNLVHYVVAKAPMGRWKRRVPIRWFMFLLDQKGEKTTRPVSGAWFPSTLLDLAGIKNATKWTLMVKVLNRFWKGQQLEERQCLHYPHYGKPRWRANSTSEKEKWNWFTLGRWTAKELYEIGWRSWRAEWPYSENHPQNSHRTFWGIDWLGCKKSGAN